MKMSLQEAQGRAIELMGKGYHCGPSVLHAMLEAYGLDNEDLLWTCTAFNGGIAGEQSGSCGAVSAATVCLGLRHRCPLSDRAAARKARSQARDDAREMAVSFRERFGAIACYDLLGLDFSVPGAYQQFLESGVWEDKCNRYVEFVIEKLYELDARRGSAAE